MDNKVVCIGGANLDIKLKAKGPFVLGSSNPVELSRSFGGVARNIAEGLARLSVPVGLISRVGLDSQGKSLLKNLSDLGIFTCVSFSKLHSTATYTALIEPDGNLLVAAADMEIYDEVTPTCFEGNLPLIRHASLMVLDTNLPENTLQFILSNRGSETQAWLVPVSVCKVDRVRSLLPKLTGLILNWDEFSVLVGEAIENTEQLAFHCKKLLKEGISALVITHGGKGLYLAQKDELISIPIAERKTTHDVTGAGDALATGLIFGLHEGRTILDSVHCGIAAAQLALQSEKTVSPVLTRTSLLKEPSLAAPV